ncbi:MAG: AraC family transcriptional regulator, partial [Bacteroidota bacterium]
SQTSPIQVYPLAVAHKLVKVPSPLFRAEYNFLLIFSHGGGSQQIDSEVLSLQKNDLLFIREGHLNSIQSIDPTTQGYFIYMDNGILPLVFTDRLLLNRLTFYPKHSLSSDRIDWLCRCCELLVQQEDGYSYTLEIQTSLLKAITSKLAEASPAILSRPDRQSEITMLFKEAVYQHFASNRDISFYADTLAVSENYLTRCVKMVTNRSPKQHINEVVIAYSKMFLRDVSKDISEIAFELNFSDVSYFGRLFKKLTDMTPTEYRNSIIQDLSE